MFKEIARAVDFIKSKTAAEPIAGIILGTGLGGLTSEIDIELEIDYDNIPNFPVSTVEGHQGKLIFGTLSGKKVVVMKGRFHYYEGYTMQQVVFPVRVMKRLGIKYLLVSNASGALNPNLFAGDLMVINDHINLLPGNPLIGPHTNDMGPRFPDMAYAYDPELIKKAIEIGNKNNVNIKTGVYVAVPGPVLETPAEYRYLRIIGGDVVGMSTIPEIIAARQAGLTCFAISVITDEGWHEIPEPLTIAQVIDTACKAEPKMTLIMKEILKQIE